MMKKNPRPERTLTALIYSALLDPSRWQVFLDQAAAEIGGAKMQIHGWTDVGGATFSATTGYDPAMIEKYQAGICRLNPWTQSIIHAPIGVPQPSQDLFPEDLLLKSLFFEEWVRPQENIVAGAGMVIGRTPSGPFMLGGNVRARDRESKQPKLLALMERLAPHLTLAWRLGQQMLEPELRLAACEIDAASPRAGMILLRPNRTVAFTDAIGERILAAQEILRLNRFGQVSLRHSDPALGAVLRGLSYGAGPLVTRVPGNSDWPTVHLVGLDQGRVKDWPYAAVLGLPEYGILCVVEPCTHRRRLPALAGYGLTQAESDVVEAIIEGESVPDIAARRNVKVATVRSQIQSIYAKSGVNNRAALVALALGTLRRN